ncbi:MAG: hypothetical protein QXT68_03775 [Halobacteria archaeon]
MGSLKGSAGVLLALLLLSGLGSAADYGTVSTLDVPLVPGESATRIQEVSRCREDGCTDTLRLEATAPPEISVAVTPPEVKVEQAKAGQTFSANVTVTTTVATPAGRYEGFLRVTSGSGDTWSYRLNVTVGRVAAAPAPAGRTSTGSGGSAGSHASSATGGSADSTLLVVAGGAVFAVILLFILQRRGLLPRGVPRPSPRGRGRGTRSPPGPRPAGSPVSTILRPLGGIAATLGGRLKGITARGTVRASDAELDSEWSRFISEKLPGEAGMEELPEAPPEEEAPPPEDGLVEPVAETPEGLPDEELTREPEPGEPPAAPGEAEPEPAAGEAGESGPEPEPEPAFEAEPEAAAAVSDDALADLRAEVERLRAGMGAVADLKSVMERSLGDLRALREEVERLRSAPRPQAAPVTPGPVVVPPEAVKKLQAELKQELNAALEAQMAGSTEKLGTWLREAVKAVTLMKAQTPQAGGPPGTTGLQPLFDGLWKEAGSLRNALQRLEMETKSALQEVARQRAPGENLVKETAALKFTLEKQQAELANLAGELQEVRAGIGKAGPGSGVAVQADLDALRTILRDNHRLMEGVEARLKNQELTFARGDEVRSLFRDLSALKEDLAQVRMQLDEAGRAPAVPVPASGRVLEAERPVASPPPAPERRDAQELEEVRKEIEKAEAFLRSLEEYHRSGLMPERLYAEKKSQSEERLKELKRKLRS